MNSIFYGLKDPEARHIISKAINNISHARINRVSFSFNHDLSFGVPAGDCKVLILWEPASVMPWQYRERNLKKFDLVIPMSSWRAKNLGIKDYAFHPYDFTQAEITSPFKKRLNKVVMINSAKFSSGKNSLYGLRRVTSKYLHESNLDYSLYGTNWKMSRMMEIRKRVISLKNSMIARERFSLRELSSELFYSYPEYKGWVENKFEILSQFDISLVIENEADWITEKIFDSLIAGAVPLYVGPDLSKQFPQLNSCILKAEPNANGIYQRLVNVSEQELDEKRHAIESFVKDESLEGIKFWSSSNQWKKVAEISRNYLESL